jgi:hypothetical protein
MLRKRTPLPWKQSDIERLLRAYEAAGYAQPTVRVTKGGDLIAIPTAKDDDAKGNELDKWIGDHARKTERA